LRGDAAPIDAPRPRDRWTARYTLDSAAAAQVSARAGSGIGRNRGGGAVLIGARGAAGWETSRVFGGRFRLGTVTSGTEAKANPDKALGWAGRHR